MRSISQVNLLRCGFRRLVSTFGKSKREHFVGIRDNFVAAFKTQRTIGLLPQRLRSLLYLSSTDDAKAVRDVAKTQREKTLQRWWLPSLNLFEIRACDDLFAFVF